MNKRKLFFLLFAIIFFNSCNNHNDNITPKLSVKEQIKLQSPNAKISFTSIEEVKNKIKHVVIDLSKTDNININDINIEKIIYYETTNITSAMIYYQYKNIIKSNVLFSFDNSLGKSPPKTIYCKGSCSCSLTGVKDVLDDGDFGVECSCNECSMVADWWP
ncbi:MAG: hypothetical protein EAZ85_06995 [Bacteroidetes bacterium]|nr:MAG: hypothetical protein EAZ85_06995 [Bacteroidota bacterium]TAG87803.1 MAG: hypothetical protein EAZ20_09855 [Bacteroidota bacterium]